MNNHYNDMGTCLQDVRLTQLKTTGYLNVQAFGDATTWITTKD